MKDYVYRNKKYGKYYSDNIFYDVELTDASTFDGETFLKHPYDRDYMKMSYEEEFRRIRRNKLRKLKNV